MDILLTERGNTTFVSGMTTRNRKSNTYENVQNILNDGGHISVSDNVGHFALNVYGKLNEVTELLYIIEFNTKQTMIKFNMKLIEETKKKFSIC